jgi:hypothetical protein
MEVLHQVCVMSECPFSTLAIAALFLFSFHRLKIAET